MYVRLPSFVRAVPDSFFNFAATLSRQRRSFPTPGIAQVTLEHLKNETQEPLIIIDNTGRWLLFSRILEVSSREASS